MPVYIVSYDLNKYKDYQRLYAAIKTYTYYDSELESFWFIDSYKSAVEIRNHLQQYVDSDDELFVGELVSNWGATNTMQRSGSWLNAGGRTIRDSKA
ncbi:hypothetical protein C7446_2304 [Kushneria sinocarnis]|uniref:CRISPR-associated protein Cas2 n=1 Tax=Kushneria sinocarnis TaxID=595502 RepID=A0A420WVK4_9GAMM|nr:hypothetical protein [Kushneria sinocarnis]RKR02586.1 hypothetical protein C7446_2304 [Kushneria sinocarnis]